MNTLRTDESNPYLQQAGNEQQKEQTIGGPLDPETEQEEMPLIEDGAAQDKRTRRRQRRIALGVIAALLLVSLVAAFALYYQRSVKVEYRPTARQARVVPPPPNTSATTGRDNRTEQAIQEVQRLTAGAGQPTNTNAQAAARSDAASSVAGEAGHSSTNQDPTPFLLPPSPNATHHSEELEKGSSSASTPANDQPPLRSQRSSETSLYVSERLDEKPPAHRISERSAATPSIAKGKSEPIVMLPPFGTMLPVRTIGGLFTLRSGALARLELTRDVTGNGWSMKRGTILVGTSKGGEYERAYVGIIGFIDPQTGKLVKLGGDVLGGDAAAGLKGKSRQVDSRWTRVLSQLGNAAVTLTGALLGGRGNGTVIISDGSRSPLITPVSDELSGVLGSEINRNRREGFVEVVAGTPGYVMVTDLPAVLKGTDANVELDEQTVASLSDVDVARPATGISEREFAELIANGSTEEIKARLHRMSPEMRKIALAVLER